VIVENSTTLFLVASTSTQAAQAYAPSQLAGPLDGFWAFALFGPFVVAWTALWIAVYFWMMVEIFKRVVGLFTKIKSPVLRSFYPSAAIYAASMIWGVAVIPPSAATAITLGVWILPSALIIWFGIYLIMRRHVYEPPPEVARAEKGTKESIWDDLWQLGAAFWFLSILSFAYSGYRWLRDGAWPSMALADFTGPFVTNWSGLNTLLNTLANGHVGYALMGVACILIFMQRK
jgi:hypothetical protein